MRVPRIARRLVRRGMSALPKPVLDVVVRAAARGSGPAVGLPAARRILVLAPHPDDETLGCGGLIAAAARGGARVTVAFVTDGEDMLVADRPRNLAADRRLQGAEACALLGARERFLGFGDGRLDEEAGPLASALRTVIADVQPELVVLPWFGDGNRDHRALNRAFADAATGTDLEVWGCEIWTPLPANRLVDISDVVDDKRRAIAVHTADVFLDPEARIGLDRYRAATARIAARYAEAYYEAPADEYAARVHAVARS